MMFNKPMKGYGSQLAEGDVVVCGTQQCGRRAVQQRGPTTLSLSCAGGLGAYGRTGLQPLLPRP
eukprot:1590832-Pyramimonas_sp.AAC.3